MNTTMLLNDNWDITLDGNGDFAWTSGNYATAQNVACACRAFTNDMYFNQEDGIPHFYTDISNPQKINTTLLAFFVEKEALKFSEVKNATLSDITIQNRILQAVLRLTLNTDEVINVSI